MMLLTIYSKATKRKFQKMRVKTQVFYSLKYCLEILICLEKSNESHYIAIREQSRMAFSISENKKGVVR